MTAPRATPGVAVSIVLVFVGGAAGGLLRHGLDELFPLTLFPASTFTINVVGSAFLAALPAIRAVDRRPGLALALGPGLLGGFTTLSAFSEQARALVDGGHPGLAASYVVASVGVALAAVLVVRRIATPAERTAFDDEGGDE